MNNKPVAILLATFNGERYIREFLDSLCGQSYKDFCLYVRDDGSTDSTLAIVDSYSSRLVIEVLPSEGRLGPAKGFLKIMEMAGAGHSCYMFADQDDYWYPDKVERAAVVLLDRKDEVLLYFSRLEYVDAELRHLTYSRIPRLLSINNAAVENVVTGCTIGISQRMRNDVLAGEPYDVLMHDWWLYLYCSAFGSVFFDDTPTIKYRQHGGNVVGAATGLIDDFRRRWARFVRRDVGVHRLSQQLKAFLNCHGSALKERDRCLLNLLVRGKEDFFTRLRLAIAPPVARQSRMDTFILRFLFLIGRY